MVTEVAGDSDFDSSSSDSEDRDDTESMFEGHAQIIWTSLEETIEKIDDILVVDRGFWYGDIVASVSDPSGQTGTVVNVDLMVDLRTPSGETIRNINSKKLLRVRAFTVGDYVIHGPWLGRVDEVVDNVTVRFDDGAKCKIMRADPEHLIPISHNLLEDVHYPYHLGQSVRGSSSSVFKNVQWLQGVWKTSRLEGTVSNVEVGSVCVNWIAAVSPSCDSQLTMTPAEQQDPDQLKLLPCFLHANWQLGDWCLLPTYKKSSESVSTAPEDVVSDRDTETTVATGNLPSDCGSTVFGFKDTMHAGRVSHCKKIHRHYVKYDKREQPKEDVLEQALFVVNTKTKVDVVWQDGTRSFCLDSRTLFSVDNLGDHDFWPEQYVLEKGSDEDGVDHDSRRVGVVKSVDSKERTVKVKWVEPVEHPKDPQEFDEEVVSVYELTEHPDYSYCIGDIVLRLSPPPEALVEFHIINQSDGQEECLEKIKLENGARSKESNLSSIGYIIGLKDGAIEVAWADGMVSKVGPQAIIVVGRGENGGSTQSSFEEEDEEFGDDSASWETLDPDGVGVRDQEEQGEEAPLNEALTKCDHGIANGDTALHAEESLHPCNGVVLSFALAVFGFVARLAISFLGFRGYGMQDTLNSSSHGQSAQKHIIDGAELDICQEKELTRNSWCHEPESTTHTGDALCALNGSLGVLKGKEDAELCCPKNDSECSDPRIEEQMKGFQYSVGDLRELTFNIVKKQKRDSGNDKSGFFKQFDSVKEPVDHYFLNETCQSSNQREWAKKVQREWIILEKGLPEKIYVRVYEDRIDLLRAVIIGAAGTPYHDGLFFFDIHLPTEYPHVPPSVYYHSSGLRLNPNLYENGKICLSLLNTWTGKGNEVWDPTNSSILQVLVSLQGLVLNAKPYFNEAGYDKQIGRAEGEKNSLAYNENSFLLSCKSMLYLIRKPPKHFELFVKEHFCNRGQHILGACNEYMKGAQVGRLSEEALMPLHHGEDSQNNSSIGFKIMLAKLIPKLVSAFSEVGADCQQFLQLVYNKEFEGMAKKTV